MSPQLADCAKTQVGLWPLSGFGVAFQPLILVPLPTRQILEGENRLRGWPEKVYSVITENRNLIGSC